MAVKKNQEIRMASFLARAIKQNDEGKALPAMKMAEAGLNYYSNRIIKALMPYASLDEPLIIIALRHIADEMERGNPGVKSFVDDFDKSLKKPELKYTVRMAKPNRFKE